MRELPIPFTGPMVLALLNGTKTQTRRNLATGTERLICRACGCGEKRWKHGGHSESCPGKLEWTACSLPRYGVGDRLWVKERMFAWPRFPGEYCSSYHADGEHTLKPWPREWTRLWSAAMHMPKMFSRLKLDVTGVKLEHLQDISEADAIAEGLIWRPALDAWSASLDPNWPTFRDPRRSYAGLWNYVNGEGSWDTNPWVAAYTFTVHKAMP